MIKSPSAPGQIAVTARLSLLQNDGRALDDLAFVLAAGAGAWVTFHEQKQCDTAPYLEPIVAAPPASFPAPQHCKY